MMQIFGNAIMFRRLADEIKVRYPDLDDDTIEIQWDNLSAEEVCIYFPNEQQLLLYSNGQCFWHMNDGIDQSTSGVGWPE